MNTNHSAHQHDGHDSANSSDTEMEQLLELDAEVLNSYLTDLTGWLAGLTDRSPRQLLDLGSGPGTGTLALTRRFPGAVVTAADSSPHMLHRLQKQAGAHGVADRIHIFQADLDELWPQAEDGQPFDLIWAAAFLHHLQDPGRALDRAFASLRPNGLLAVTEMDFFPRFLPQDTGVGRPGLEARLHAVTNTRPPHEWSGHLQRAGFTPHAHRHFEIHLDPAQAGPELNGYAQACLAKLRSHARNALTQDDLAALDTLLDGTHPNSIARRRDLTVHTTRTTWVARRT